MSDNLQPRQSEITAHLKGGPLDGRTLAGHPLGKYLLVPGESQRYVFAGLLDDDKDQLVYEWRHP